MIKSVNIISEVSDATGMASQNQAAAANSGNTKKEMVTTMKNATQTIQTALESMINVSIGRVNAEGYFSPEGRISEIAITFDDSAACDSFVSAFPKYCKLRANNIQSGTYKTAKPYVSMDLRAATDERTGAVNETAEKRINKIIEILTDITVKNVPFLNRNRKESNTPWTSELLAELTDKELTHKILDAQSSVDLFAGTGRTEMIEFTESVYNTLNGEEARRV